MIVIGVDPGISNLGLGVVSGDAAAASFVAAELVRTRHQDPAPVRIRQIFDRVSAVIAAHRPEAHLFAIRGSA